MTNRIFSTVNTGFGFAGQLPSAARIHVELGANQDRTLLEKSKVRSRNRLLFIF